MRNVCFAFWRLFAAAAAGGSEWTRSSTHARSFGGSELTDWEFLPAIALGESRYIDAFAVPLVNMTDSVTNLAKGIVTGTWSMLREKLQKTRPSNVGVSHASPRLSSIFLELNTTKRLSPSGITPSEETEKQNAGTYSKPDERGTVTKGGALKISTDDTEMGNVTIVTKVKGHDVSYQDFHSGSWGAEYEIATGITLVFYGIVLLVKRQFRVKRRRRDEEELKNSLQDYDCKPLESRGSLSYDSEDDEDLDRSRSSSTWQRDSAEIFFWFRFYGIGQDGKPNVLLGVHLAFNFAYVACKVFMTLTMEGRLPVPCRVFIIFARLVTPDMLVHHEAQYEFMVQITVILVMMRNILFLIVIVMTSRSVATCCDQILAYRVRILKQPETRSKLIDKLLKFGWIWFDFWTGVGGFLLLAFWNLPSGWQDQINGGDSVYIVNFLLNMYSDVFITWTSGLVGGLGFIQTMLMMDWVDVIASRIMAISPKDTKQIHERVKDISDSVHELHWGYFKDKMHTYEVLVGLLGILFFMQTASYIAPIVPLSVLVTGEGRQNPHWEVMKFKCRRMIVICAVSGCLAMGLPVLVNKHCDRLWMRINDLQMNIICTAQIDENNPESHSTSRKDRSELSKAAMVLYHLQAFLDHTNLKSGLGVCIVGIRITAKLAKMVLTAIIFAVVKCENYVAYLLD